MVKRILVALSGTPYTRVAVEHALELAKIHEAEITGVTILNPEAISNVGSIPVGAAAVASELAEYRETVTHERIEEAIEQFENECRDAGMIHCVAREEGDTFDELISLWRYHDLTILGLRGLFEYGIVHNPDDYLIRLVKEGVRPILAVSKEFRKIQRVLIAYNGSMASANAMKQFVRTHIWRDLQIKIVCFEKDPAQAEMLLAAAASYCAVHGYEAELEHDERSAKDHLLDHADGWKADLLVMGSTARSRMASFFLGSSTLTAIRNAEHPLYLMR